MRFPLICNASVWVNLFTCHPSTLDSQREEERGRPVFPGRQEGATLTPAQSEGDVIRAPGAGGALHTATRGATYNYRPAARGELSHRCRGSLAGLRLRNELQSEPPRAYAQVEDLGCYVDVSTPYEISSVLRS